MTDAGIPMALALVPDVPALFVLALLVCLLIVMGSAIAFMYSQRWQHIRVPYPSRTATTVLRGIVGWPLIAVGLLTFPLPIPVGLPLLVVGTLIIGPRSRPIRLATIMLRQGLRRWSRLRVPLIGPLGRWLLEKQRRAAAAYRRRRRVVASGAAMPLHPNVERGAIRANHNPQNPENETAG
jgi:hypothetical protein